MRNARRGRYILVGCDDLPGVHQVALFFDPDRRRDLGKRQLAKRTAGIFIEDARLNASGRKQPAHEMRFGQVGSGIEPLHK